MKVTAIKCRGCGQIIYPRTSQDLRSCKCGGVLIIAWPNCFKINSQGLGSELVTLDLPDITINDLRKDFKKKINRYGIKNS